MGVHEGRYPLIRPRDRGHDSLSHHFIDGPLCLLLVLYGYLSMGVLDFGTVGSVLMVKVLGMFSMLSKEQGNAPFKATMSWATTVGGSVD